MKRGEENTNSSLAGLVQWVVVCCVPLCVHVCTRWPKTKAIICMRVFKLFGISFCRICHFFNNGPNGMVLNGGQNPSCNLLFSGIEFVQ